MLWRQSPEPGYFKRLKGQEQNRLLEVVIYPSGETPKTLVESAVDKKREAQREARSVRNNYLKYDEVWCVFDVDEHPRLPDAKQQARDNGIQLAISNPCFELWILLHFRDQTAHVHRHEAQRACQEYLPDYQKDVPFDALRPHYEDAVARARALDHRQETAGDAGGNPSTGVYRLTERIHELGREEQLRRLGR